MRSLQRSLALRRLLLLTVVVLLASAGTASSSSSAKLSCHLTKKSFTSSRASTVKLVCSFPVRTKSLSSRLTIKSGKKWKQVKSLKLKVKKSPYSTSAKKLFGSRTVKVGSYRLKISSVKSSKTLSFTVTKPTIEPKKPIGPTVQPIGLTVTNSNDIVNGDVKSPATLVANPGRDGISFCEALDATNSAPGTGAFSITFSSDLAGRSIVPVQPLPPLTRDGVTITGLAGSDGKPTLTLSMGGTETPLLQVQASHIAIRHLHFVQATGSASDAILIHFGSDPMNLTDLRIEQNAFDSQGTGGHSPAIQFADRFGSGGSATGITISQNTFNHYVVNDGDADRDAIMVNNATGQNGVIDGLVISDNRFSDSGFPIEIDQSGSNNKTSNVQIVRNVFQNDAGAVAILNLGDQAGGQGWTSSPATGDVIENTYIAQNDCSGSQMCVGLTGGLANATGDTIRGTQIVNNSFHDNVAPINLLNGNPGNLPASANNVVEDTLISGNICSNNKQVCIAIGQQFANATRNVIRNTQIVNNVISFLDPGAGGGIGVNGGGSGGNSVQGVTIVNDTIAGNGNQDLSVEPGSGVSGLEVFNSILWGGVNDIAGVSPDQVRYSDTPATGYAGVNGNIVSDPRFVNQAAGDFHLQAGSPAIDAGTSDGAPTTDKDGKPRWDDPATSDTGAGAISYVDIGAFEYQG